MQSVEYAEEQGIDCSASVFGEDEFEFLIKTNPTFMKFAYSQNHQSGWVSEAIERGINAIVSCDVMSDMRVPKKATKLFCVPQYPVYFEICFDELFPRFDGFSDHTMGYQQTISAVIAGAKIIEKHIKLNHSDVVCPDSFFALGPGDLAAMVSEIRRVQE